MNKLEKLGMMETHPKGEKPAMSVLLLIMEF